MAAMIEEEQLSSEEASLYDRQIRLWGVEAQSRLQKAKVFISGFRGVHCEVVKNIVLAGISIVLHDTENVNVQDLASNFFLSPEHIGSNRASAGLDRVKEMNPFTSVTAETRPISELDDSFFSQFSVIMLSDCVESDVLRLNAIARGSAAKPAFFWSGCFGTEGWFLCDFGPKFEYKSDPVPNVASDPMIHSVKYPSVKEVLAAPWPSLVSRHFPLNPTWVRARVLAAFHDKHKRKPGINDVENLSTVASELLEKHQVATAPTVKNGRDFVAALMASIPRLCECHDAMLSVIAAVVGGFLAQEVLKAAGRVGEPMQNIFVFSGEENTAKAFPAAMPKQEAPATTKGPPATTEIDIL